MPGRRQSWRRTHARHSPSNRRHRNHNIIGQSTLQRRVFNNRSWRFHNDELHGGRNLLRLQTPCRKPEGRVIPAINRVRVQSTDPTPLIQEMFRRLQLPHMSWDAAYLDIDELGQGDTSSILEPRPTPAM